MFALIMAGGVGKRFWPFSRSVLPKQFLNITGKDTMLEQTVSRLEGLVTKENTVVVINKEHGKLTENMTSLSASLILEEPLGKNTAPCIGLAAIHLYLKDPDLPVAVIPSDHYIPDSKAFRKTLQKASVLAKDGYIVTIGIKPTRPDTGYGYIWMGKTIEQYGNAHSVKKFVEKPDFKKAMEYLECGEYLWNGGFFIFTPRVIMEELSLHLPDLYERLKRIKNTINTDLYNETLEREYRLMPSISIDYGIMEKTSRPVSVIPADFAWSDVGSWQSLYTLKSADKEEDKNITEGNIIAIDTKNSFLVNKTDRLISVIGQKDLLVVNTEDATLVMNLNESQRVQEIVEEIKKKKMEDYL